MEFTHDEIPPKSFLKDLRSYDPALGILWNNKERRWLITRTGKQGIYGILKLKFKELDRRVFERLNEGDLWKHKKPQTFEDYIDSYTNKLDKEKELKTHDEIIENAERAWVNKLRENKDHFYMGA